VFAVAAIAFALGWLIAACARRNCHRLTPRSNSNAAAVDKLAEIEKTFACCERSTAPEQQVVSATRPETLKHSMCRQGDLDLKEKAVENMVRPIARRWKNEQQVRLMEQERKSLRRLAQTP